MLINKVLVDTPKDFSGRVVIECLLDIDKASAILALDREEC
jgi:hypothetical protein